MLVGKQKKEFTLHLCFATKTSEFFKAATRGEWVEAKTKIIRLPEANVKDFEIYLQWMYTKAIVFDDCDPTYANFRFGKEEDRDRLANVRYPKLVDLYILGDALMDKAFRNAVIDTIVETILEINKHPGNDDVIKAWNQTPIGSMLRKILLDSWTASINVTIFDEYKSLLPPDFRDDLIREVIRVACGERNKEEGPQYATRCKYHEHDDSAPKCS